MTEPLEFAAIIKPNCVYIHCESISPYYQQNDLKSYLFDDQPVKPTLKPFWYELPELPKVIKHHISPKYSTIGYQLKAGFVATEQLPQQVVPEFFAEDEDGDCEHSAIMGLYEPIRECIQQEGWEPIEFKITIIAIKATHWKFVKAPNNVQHMLLDEIETNPALLQDKLCQLTAQETYAIIRNHVRKNIDHNYAFISSDYDFCFTVEKRIPLETPIKIESVVSNKKGRKGKTEVSYRDARTVVIFKLAPSSYQAYPVAQPFKGHGYEDLELNITKYLNELMMTINAPVKDCPHCKGLGVIFSS